MTPDQITNAKGLEGRIALRSFVTGHDGWNSMRTDNGLDLGSLTMPGLKIIARALYLGSPLTDEECTIVQAPKDDEAAVIAPKPIDKPLVVDAPHDNGMEDDAATLARIFRDMANKGTKAIDETAVRTIVDKAINEAMANATNIVRVEVKRGDDIAKRDMGPQHKQFPLLIKTLAARHPTKGFPLPVWLSGPAGAGKTFGSESAAKAYAQPFYHQPSMLMPHDLLGFRDGFGKYRSTQFVDAYRYGGFVLLDEVDSGGNEALLALKGALANGHIMLPIGGDDASWIERALKLKASLGNQLEGLCNEDQDWIKAALDKGLIRLPTDEGSLVPVKRHPDCYILAAGNTWGLGATADYIGRNKLDAAFLDEFIKIDWQYDESFERSISGNVDWAVRVQKARQQAKTKGLKIIISPRATLHGASLIAAGFTPDEAAHLTYLGGLSSDQIKMLEG